MKLLRLSSDIEKIPTKESEESETQSKKVCNQDQSVINDLLNIRHRNAGLTSDLNRRAQKSRNEKIHNLVNFASFGDVKGFSAFDYFYQILVSKK